ncbi:cupin [Mycobacterium sp. ST-F2]|uniref:cupin domain-containing protein n=1 Tax=Mycobacterium sp. ST-F2 TaxID=1490484 RepID=UPI00093F3F3B|nr:cupin domain-containing protein [Mycobacterium sp. ST-F2]OKH86168.1 cupin [Mycobacterium sp. ST-F2]
MNKSTFTVAVTGSLATIYLTGSALAVSAAAPTTTDVQTPLIEQALPNVPGKTFTSSIVEFPPSFRALPHRHGDAFIYAYVLEGSIRSQVDDAPVRTYLPGENWIEQPGAHHVVTENTSQTERAKLLVVFISNTGDNLKIDDPHQ